MSSLEIRTKLDLQETGPILKFLRVFQLLAVRVPTEIEFSRAVRKAHLDHVSKLLAFSELEETLSRQKEHCLDAWHWEVRAISNASPR